MVRRPRLVAVGLPLIATLVTCVDHRTPTSSEPIRDNSPAAASVAAVPVTQTVLTAGHDPNNLRTYTTGSIAPGSNALITVAVLTHQSSSAAPVPTLSGGGMTGWDVVATTTFNGVTPLDRVTVFRAMSATPGSGPITITSSVTVSNCQWIVSQWDGVETSGTNGSAAIVQTGGTSGTAVNGLTVTLGAFADPGDVAYGVFGIASATPVATAGSGFTRIDEQPSGEGTTGDLFAEWVANHNAIDATWTSRNAGALGVEIRAAAGGGGVSASLSTLTASPTSLTAGSAPTTITVTAKDANGQPVSGATIQLSASGTGNTLTQPPAPSDANGVATGTLSSTVAETKTVSAKVNGTAIKSTAMVNVTPGPVSASQSTIAAAPPTILPATGTSTIIVTAKDANGNSISGATVVLATTGSAALTQPADTTAANGVATGTLSSPVEVIVLVSATINGTPITQTALVQVVAQAAGTISHALLTSGNNPANQRIYTTATISPAPNALITVAVLMRRSGGALTPTITGGGMTAWDAVASADFDTQGSPTKRLTIFRAMSSSPGSGPITISYGSSVSNAQWVVSQWAGVETSGTNGSGAIVQTGLARSDAATSLAVPLARFTGATDVAYGVVGVAKNGPIVNPASGFAEIAEVSSGENSALEAEWATNQSTVGATWTASTKAALLGVEIKARGTVSDGFFVARTALDGSPFGVAVTDQGTAFVLRHTANVVSRFDLPSSVVDASFAIANNPTSVAFDASGATAYVTAQFADRVEVIDAATNTIIDSFPTTGDPFIVRVSPDNQSIWVTTNTNVLYQFNRTTKSVVAAYGITGPPNGIAFNPTNDSLLYVSDMAGSVTEVNYKRQTLGRRFTPGGKPQSLVVSPDGALLYLANETRQEIEIFDLASGTGLSSISTGGPAFDLVLSPDGAILWTTLSGTGRVRAYDRVSHALLRDVATGGAPRRIGVTTATNLVVVANEAGWVDFLK